MSGCNHMTCCCGEQQDHCDVRSIRQITVTLSGITLCGCQYTGLGFGNLYRRIDGGSPNFTVVLTPLNADEWQTGISLGNPFINVKYILPGVTMGDYLNEGPSSCNTLLDTEPVWLSISWNNTGLYVALTSVSDVSDNLIFEATSTTPGGQPQNFADAPIPNDFDSGDCGGVSGGRMIHGYGGQATLIQRCCTESICDQLCPESSGDMTVTVVIDGVGANIDGTYELTQTGDCYFEFEDTDGGGNTTTITLDGSVTSGIITAQWTSADPEIAEDEFYRGGGACIVPDTEYPNLIEGIFGTNPGTAMFTYEC